MTVNNSSENNTLDYTVEFAENSTAMGVMLLLLYNGPDGSNPNGSLSAVQDKANTSTPNQLVNISSGEYRALAFGIGSDGMLNSEPAVSTPVHIKGNSGKIALKLF